MVESEDGLDAIAETIEVEIGPEGATFRISDATYLEVVGLIVFAILVYIWVSRPGRRRRSRLP